MAAGRDPIERLLPPSLRAALARRELLVRRPVAGLRHGVHRSLRPGIGRDFRDYRAYVPGDDPRRLDWRAAARSQRLVVRQAESEDELDLVLALDGSGAMAYGEVAQEQGDARQKWAWAGTVAAALASLALRQGDRVGFVIGRRGAVEAAALEPAARRDRLRTLAASVAEGPGGDCPFDALLDALAPRLRRRALVVVLSDFLDPGGVGSGVSAPADASGADVPAGEASTPARGAETSARASDEALLRGLTSLRASGHDVALVQILHRDELEFPWDRERVLELVDPRGRRPTVEGPGASLRDAYLERLDAHLRWLERGCERGGLLLTRIVSDVEPVGPILELLARLAGGPVDTVARVGSEDGGRRP